MPKMIGPLKPWVDSYLGQRGWELTRCPAPLHRHPEARLRVSFDLVVSHFLLRQSNPFFVQVGAFNGVDGDPIHAFVARYGLRGLLIEPQPDAFEDLKRNYQGQPGLLFKNAAVGANDGRIPLYCVRPGIEGPNWLPQIASFDKQHVLKYLGPVPDVERAILEVDVECVTFQTLFREFGVGRVDILIVDTEGYDYEVIKQFNVRETRPAIIHFEHKLLRRRDHWDCVRDLVDIGYKIALDHTDTTAYLAPRE